MKYFSFYIGIFLLLFSVKSTAQQKDSVQTMRRFIKLCQAYKQTPLHLSLEYTASVNFAAAPDEQSTLQAEFYLTSAGAYMKFGELEQLVSDSMALLVSEKMQRMFLYTRAAPVIAQMKAMAGMPVPESSVKNMCDKYRVSTGSASDGTKSIVLENRNILQKTSLPGETIELRYDAAAEVPVRIVVVQRGLVPIPRQEYEEKISQKEWKGKLFKAEEEDYYYAVKEKTETYVYKKIEHEASVKIPVRFEERIIKNDSGKYVPVKAYENYILTEE